MSHYKFVPLISWFIINQCQRDETNEYVDEQIFFN